MQVVVYPPAWLLLIVRVHASRRKLKNSWAHNYVLPAIRSQRCPFAFDVKWQKSPAESFLPAITAVIPLVIPHR